MKTFKLTFSQPKKPLITGLALGVFDGIHRGHQQLLNQANALLTFNPHPAEIIKNASVSRLTTIDEMTTYCPNIFTLTFTPTIAKMSALDYLNNIIKKEINPKKIIVGYDYNFGTNREGNIELLKQWGNQQNIIIQEIAPFTYKSQLIKSRVIRTAITNGNFNQGIDWLGHDYLIKGIVIKGDGRGKKLGFPTANLAVPPNKCIPQNGVYQGSVIHNHNTYKAMIYIGNKPTFNQHQQSIEVHILDFNQNIYDTPLNVFISKKIRDEKTFSSTTALINQIKQDIQTTYEN
ncbi:hypothetical protein DID76_02600 [Candidatus Marinamargulisbacteria bacterium SCGC AG-414-C22]|nr:hypothetical protein DID76_02600 [Candidatus Marinamargulisbacteria bacterium SCGC AG-414-C22]